MHQFGERIKNAALMSLPFIGDLCTSIVSGSHPGILRNDHIGTHVLWSGFCILDL